MNKCVLFLIVLLFSVNISGQSNLTVKKKLPVAGKNKSKIVIFPIFLESKLTKLQVFINEEKSFLYKDTSSKNFSKLFSFLRISQFFKTGVWKNDDGTFSARSVSDQAFYPAISYKDKIYIFSESVVETDSEIFNLFLKEANLKIKNEREAAELTNLYFAVTRGYFENKGKLILSGVEDIPLSYRKAKEAETNRLREIVAAPKTKLVDEGYEVELYTWEMALGEVKKWNFKIQPDAQIEVQSDIIGKL